MQRTFSAVLLGAVLLCGGCAPDPPSPDNATAPAPVVAERPTGGPAAATVYPGQSWARATPAQANVDSVALASALDYLAGHCGENGLTETLVVRYGRVIWAGDSIRKVHDIWSCTKSFTSALAGMLVEEGKIDLDDTVSGTVPELRQHYPTATYRHFLTMTSGYNAVGRSRWAEDSEDWSRTPFRPAPPLFAPGTAFAYWDEAYIMLGRALTLAAGTSLENYAAERLMSPLGIKRWTWWSETATADGTPLNFGGTGLKLSAADQARFGLLFLNAGRWRDRQLLPADYVARATSVQVSPGVPVADTDRRNVVGPGRYGLGWWVIEPAAGVPTRAFYTSGLNHNVCLVIPAWDMVVVRAGTDGNPAAGKHAVYTELVRKLADAIGEYARD